MAYAKAKKIGRKSAASKKRRTSKKGGRKPAPTKIKSLVALEVQKVLNTGAHKEKRKVTMELCMPDTGVYINGKAAFNNTIRIPITAALPSMGGVGQGADVRRRGANKVMLTGVNVRASFSVSDETRVMLLPYEPHESVARTLASVGVSMEPDPRLGEVPEVLRTAMVPAGTLGLLSKHGPLMVKKSGSSIALDTGDGSVWECRVSNHAGKPIGAAYRAKFGSGVLRRTLNWNQSAADGVGLGYTAWSTHMVNQYWKLDKTYTYMYEGQNDQVFDRDAEMFLYVDCPSEQAREISEGTPIAGARVRNVIVDIYFHDM
jgi:hypothetical protein